MKEKRKDIIIIVLVVLLLLSCYMNLRQYMSIRGFEDAINDIRTEKQAD